MNKEQVLRFINKVEANYPVDTWEIYGIRIWPFVRIRLARGLFEDTLSTDGPSPPAPSLSRWHNGLKVLHQLPVLLTAWRKLRRFRRGVDFVYLAYAAHRTLLPEGWFNRMADPLMALQNNAGQRSVLLEYEESFSYAHSRVHESSVVSLQPLTFLFYLVGTIHHLIDRRAPRSLTRYPAFLSELRQLGFDTIAHELSLSRITYRATVMRYYSRFYQRWLLRLRPSAVFVVCYYSFESMVMCDAAYRLGIPTVDLQHGIQGPQHTSYARWNKVPPNGYSLLPRIFWTWDEPSATVIRSWPGSSEAHQPFVGGNPWLAYWQTEQILVQPKRIPRKIVLYSLQPIPDLFPVFLREAIVATPEVDWWVRLHPRQAHRQAAITDTIRTYGLSDRVNVSDATRLPLPAVLAQTSVHVTQWSSVVWEAAAYGIPSVVIHPSGLAVFADQPAESMIHFAQSADEVTKLVRQLARSSTVVSDLAHNNQESLVRLTQLIHQLSLAKECR